MATLLLKMLDVKETDSVSKKANKTEVFFTYIYIPDINIQKWGRSLSHVAMVALFLPDERL